MITDAGSLVRFAGAILIVALGAYVASRRPRRAANAWFALFVIPWGVYMGLWSAVTIDDPLAPLARAVAGVANAIGAVGLVGFMLHAPKPPGAHERRAVARAAAVGGIVVLVRLASSLYVLAVRPYLDGAPMYPGTAVAIADILRLASTAFSTGAFAFALILLPGRYAASRPDDTAFRREMLLLAAVLAVFPMFLVGLLVDRSFTLRLAGQIIALAMLAVGLAASAAWLTIASRAGEPRGPVAVALITPAFALVALALSVFTGWRAYDAAQVTLVVLLAYAVLRHQLFGIDVKVRWTISKSTIAAVFIAVFFIASEAAQQFFGAAFNSAYVGIGAAGMLVFAIAPLQRAAERIAEKAVPVTTPASVGVAPVGDAGADRRAGLYRRAVRFAIRDGRISPEEELHLFEVAQEMGLGAGEAMRLRQEVEREARAGVA